MQPIISQDAAPLLQVIDQRPALLACLRRVTRYCQHNPVLLTQRSECERQGIDEKGMAYPWPAKIGRGEGPRR